MTATKWLGRCPDCDSWNSFAEEAVEKAEGAEAATVPRLSATGKPLPYDQVATEGALRTTSGLEEFDRVLGGGIVQGSLVLLGGDPGIGKSTLLLQVAAERARGGETVVYVSGEESERQIKLRGERLDIHPKGLLLFSETELDRILSELRRLDPALVVLDSVQTAHSSRFSSAPGSITQVREVTAELLYYAKSSSTPVF
jgi:DNA repair protein RadA/Sms